ncbi:RNA-binding protein [Catellatospora sichuanensis]|uniref:RNA-binding protein n=1 Tax=Catellatospora sichuanensis TaxID=1969805 RepID=UPI0011824B85|nr:RNA-binding protein [Catellatospora sichuanensis]
MSVTTGRGQLSRRLFRGLLDGVAPQLRWVLIALVLAGTALFGGLETAPPKDKTPQFAVGVPVDGGPWRVEVIDVRLAGDLPPLHRQDEKNRWLYVTANVTITAHESWTLTSKMMRLSGVEGLIAKEPSDMVLYRDKRVIRRLHPNMPEKVAFFWEQSGDAPVPTTVTVLVLGMTYRGDSFSTELQWRANEDPSGRVTVPVIDVRASRGATPSPGTSPSPDTSPRVSASGRPGATPSVRTSP